MEPFGPPDVDADASTTNRRRRLIWRADFGEGRRIDVIAEYLQDLGVLIELGERWAVRSAIDGSPSMRHEPTAEPDEDPSGRRAELQHLLAEHSDEASGLMALGQLYLHHGFQSDDPEELIRAAQEAEVWFRQAADQGSAEGMIRLGEVLAILEQDEEAEFWLQAAVDTASDPLRATALVALGDMYRRRDDIRGAEQFYRLAVLADPSNLLPTFNLGQLSSERGDLSGAAEWFRQTLSAAGVSPDIAENLASPPTSWDVVRAIEEQRDSHRSAETVRPFGDPLTVVSVTYRNPLEIVIGGSGVLFVGVTYLLKMARDWGNKRREGAAAATIAENAARRAATHADLAEFLVDEAMQGRYHLPPRELLDLITKPELAALDRIASREAALELPPGEASEAEDRPA